MLTPYALRTPVIARIDGADRPGEIRGRCHPIDGGDLYDVMTSDDRAIHCNVRPEQIEPAGEPVLRIGSARR
jgi:hypothetical protein